MSILVSRKTQIKEEVAQASQSKLLTPTSMNVWTAGTPAPTVRQIAAEPVHVTPVRALHQGQHDGKSVQAYMEFAHLPTGLATAQDVTDTSKLAIEELTQYAENLTKPMLCERVNIDTAAPGTQIYESINAYAPHASIENISRNLKQHNLCVKCTVSDPVLSFQPFVVKLTSDDLDNCLNHTEPILAQGVESKFIKTVSQVAPHTVLFHIVKNPTTSQHFFYGINFTQSDTF